MRPICIILIILSSIWSACNTKNSTGQSAAAILSAADSLQFRVTADSLVAVADTASVGQDSLLFRAADLYKTLRDSATWVKTQRALFNHYRKDNQYELISQLLGQAIREIWWEEEAEAGKLYTLLGFTLRRMGRNYAASINYEKARALSDRFGGVTKNNPAGPIYKTLANIKTRLGENEEAIKLLQAGLDLLQRDTAPEAWLDNQITRAEIYDDLGIAFQNNNQLAQASEQYDAGLVVLAQLKDLPEKARAEVASTKGLLLSNKASALFSLGQIGDAETVMRAALDALPPNKTNYRFSALNILAEINAAQGNDQAAQQNRQTALDLSSDSSIEHREVAKLLNEMGWSAYRQRDFQAAMQFAQKALHLIYPAVSPDDYRQNPRLALIDPDPENTTAEALDLKGEALWQLSQAPGSGQFLLLADSTTALAVQMMENLRDVAVYESSKLQAAQKSRLLFSRMMRVLYAQKAAGNVTAAERAFAFAEKSKAVLLQQKIAGDAALLAAGVADTLIQQERDLKEQRAFLRNELFEQEISADDSKESLVQELKRRLFQAEQTLRNLQSQIATKYKLPPQEYHSYVATVADVQKKLLRKNETWVEYFTDPDSNWVYLIAVDANGLRFDRQPYQESDIRDFIRLFNDEIQAENRSGDPALFAEFTQTAYQLYRSLIAPAFSKKIPERLTLAPDGALALLPFDVLISALPKDTSKADYAGLSFLVGSSQLRLAPSASLDLFYAQQAQPEHRGIYAGFAPDYSNSVLGEVVSGADLVRATATAFQGAAFVGAGACLDSFLLEAAGHAIIHFHGHAEASDSFPDYSWMAFTAGQPITGRLLPRSHQTNTLGSGPARLPAAELAHCLFAHQVYQSHLDADLVLLSACQTGLGKIAPGEGTLSLSRAFQAAGCPATVMSLWKVRDDATAQLMGLFLENIRQGQDKDEALTKAKRTYLQTVGDAFPYYWAGFVLTGKTGPVHLAKAWWKGPLGWLLAGLCVLILMYGYRFFRRN